jgi:hypothetical protein
VRGSGSERLRLARIAAGRPGSPCPRGWPPCTPTLASRSAPLRGPTSASAGPDRRPGPAEVEKEALRATTLPLVHLRITWATAPSSPWAWPRSRRPQAGVPRPNLAWFDRTYSCKR